MCSLSHSLIQQIYTEHHARSWEYTIEQNKLNLYSSRAYVLKEANFKLMIYLRLRFQPLFRKLILYPVFEVSDINFIPFLKYQIFYPLFLKYQIFIH